MPAATHHKPWRRRPAVLRAAVVCAFGFLAGIPPAPADVYSVAPSGRAADSVAGLLQPQIFLREPVSVNGRTGELSVGTSRLSPAEALAVVKGGAAGWKIRTSGDNAFVVDEPGSGAGLRRHSVYAGGGAKTTVVFSLRMPAAEPGGDAPEWPKEIPQPQGRAEMVMRLEKNKSTFAVTAAMASPEVAARAYDEALRNAGWSRMSVAPSASATKGEYTHAKTSRLLVFQAGESPAGGSTVSVFCSPLR